MLNIWASGEGMAAAARQTPDLGYKGVADGCQRRGRCSDQSVTAEFGAILPTRCATMHYLAQTLLPAQG